jgi:hypothetical protein
LPNAQHPKLNLTCRDIEHDLQLIPNTDQSVHSGRSPNAVIVTIHGKFSARPEYVAAQGHICGDYNMACDAMQREIAPDLYIELAAR